MARFVDDVRISGKAIRGSRDLVNNLTAASMSGSLTEITQIDMTFVDPNFALIKTGVFRLGNSVDIEDFDMEIASVSTGGSPGAEEITVKARPRIVRKLKNRRGARVMKNTSPSEFIRSECRAVGAKYSVQDTAKRKQVARDVPKKGQGEVETPPSSWTTFQRLANESGFVMFETAGRIHFGKPNWLIKLSSVDVLRYRYKTGRDDNLRTYDVPVGTRSLDSPGETVDFTARATTLNTIRTGSRFSISNFPFGSIYLVTRFSIDMMDPQNLVQVTGALSANAA